MRLVMVINYIKFPTGAWGIYFAKVRNFHLQKTRIVLLFLSYVLQYRGHPDNRYYDDGQNNAA